MPCYVMFFFFFSSVVFLTLPPLDTCWIACSLSVVVFLPSFNLPLPPLCVSLWIIWLLQALISYCCRTHAQIYSVCIRFALRLRPILVWLCKGADCFIHLAGLRSFSCTLGVMQVFPWWWDSLPACESDFGSSFLDRDCLCVYVRVCFCVSTWFKGDKNMMWVGVD